MMWWHSPQINNLVCKGHHILAKSTKTIVGIHHSHQKVSKAEQIVFSMLELLNDQNGKKDTT